MPFSMGTGRFWAEHGITQKKAQEPRAKFPPPSPTEQGENNLKQKVLTDMCINVHVCYFVL